jgi:thioredoxin reductase (NADPH)
VLERIDGHGKVQQVTARNVATGAVETWPVDGVFVFIGHFPNSQLFTDQLAVDEQGFLIVDKFMQTSVPGVFAAGEIMDPIYKQAVSSAGQGCMAAISVERYLEALSDQEPAKPA